MSFNELVADVLTNYAVAWQGSDGAECFGIAMELFNLIEQHVAEAVAREREELLDLVDSYAKDNADLKDAIRARAEKETK